MSTVLRGFLFKVLFSVSTRPEVSNLIPQLYALTGTLFDLPVYFSTAVHMLVYTPRPL